MREIKKVNVIGNDVHSARYRDALLFYPGVNEVSVNNNCYEQFDTIVVAEPYYISRPFIRDLLNSNFSGCFIIEKMPFSTHEELKSFLLPEKKFKVYFSLLRLYEPKLVLPAAADYDIRWPNLSCDGMDITAHTLPNVLLFLKKQSNIKSVGACAVQKTREGVQIKLNEKTNFNILIYNTNDKTSKVKINDFEINWPSYIQLIWNMLDDIREEKYDEGLTNSLVADIIKILENCN